MACGIEGSLLQSDTIIIAHKCAPAEWPHKNSLDFGNLVLIYFTADFISLTI